MAFAVDQATSDDVAVLSMLIETYCGATDMPSDAEGQRMINLLLFGDVPLAWTLLAPRRRPCRRHGLLLLPLAGSRTWALDVPQGTVHP
jgi:hypothetical protein